MTNKKYHRDVKKMMSSHNYYLKRQTNHFIFKHIQTGHIIVMSKSPSISGGIKSTKKIIEKQLKKTG